MTRFQGRVVKEWSWEGDAGETSNFNIAATNELRRLGYDVRDATDSAFSSDSALAARYQVAATVHSLNLRFELRRESGNYSTASAKSWGAAEMLIDFEVYDALRKQIVSRKQVTGHGFAEGRTPMPMPEALLFGLRSALADEVFVDALLASDGTAQDREGPIRVRRCPVRQGSRGLDAARDASVSVAVGGAFGAGTLISDDGFVLTAAHILNQETSAAVRLASGLELPGEVVRRRPDRDVALLKIPGRGYACLRTAASPPSIGTELWAVGNPAGEQLARSVTRGVLSGHPTLDGRPYLQTDASVSPGNSGGPLVDAAGEIRGVVVGKIAHPGVEGLGFAVPIGDAEKDLEVRWE